MFKLLISIILATILLFSATVFAAYASSEEQTFVVETNTEEQPCVAKNCNAVGKRHWHCQSNIENPPLDNIPFISCDCEIHNRDRKAAVHTLFNLFFDFLNYAHQKSMVSN